MENLIFYPIGVLLCVFIEVFRRGKLDGLIIPFYARFLGAFFPTIMTIWIHYDFLKKKNQEFSFSETDWLTAFILWLILYVFFLSSISLIIRFSFKKFGFPVLKKEQSPEDKTEKVTPRRKYKSWFGKN